MSVEQRVLDALPEKGRLCFVRDVCARVRVTRTEARQALSALRDAGLVIHRSPFDTGQPDRWGRA